MAAFKINKEYAAKYDSWRQKEELMKLKARYGDNPSSEDSSSESDDDVAEEVTPEVEKEFFRTLSCLKSRDPKIYQKDVNFFQNKDDIDQSFKKQKKTKEKPMYMKDYERKIMVDNEGQFVDEDDFDDVPRKATKRKHEKQKKEILQEFQKATEDLDHSDDEILQKRSNIKQNGNDLSYKDMLKSQTGSSAKTKSQIPEDLKPLQKYWTDPQLDDGESFLRDYILEKKYIGPRDKEKNPTYEEIVNPNDDLSEDEQTLMTQLDFEHKFNFRFEEPDPEFIKRYPRTMDFAMRKKRENRIKKRAETRSRKEKAKQKKKSDLDRLKALKRKEILDRLEKIKKITGDSVPGGFEENDIDGEFDPDEHDRRMQEIFNQDYYGVDEEDKPEIPLEDEDDLMTEDWDNWNVEKKEYEVEDWPQVSNDRQGDEDSGKAGPSRINVQAELMEKSRGKKKRRSTKFYEMINAKRPAFEPDKKTIEEYTDEYYKLDYEDIIDDIPCRFKYRQVAPNDFGLTLDEILGAEDRELNQWCPVRTTCQYKTDFEEKNDLREYKKKGRRWKKKASVFKSIYAPNEVKDSDADQLSISKDPPPQKIQERLWKGNNDEFIELPDERLAAYGIDPQEYNKQKRRTQNSAYRRGKFKRNVHY